MSVMSVSALKMPLRRQKKKSMLPRARINGSIWKFSIPWFSKHHCLIHMHDVADEPQAVVVEKEVLELHQVVLMEQHRTSEMVLLPQANLRNGTKTLLLEVILQER